ncbi:MAG: two-component regulator propeller domain-containing protein [Actinomycetota bacterium]
MATRTRTRRVVWAALAVAVAGALPAAASHRVPAIPIPQDPDSPAKGFVGRSAHPHPIRVQLPPRHPFMAPNGRSNIHNDAYMSDVYAGPGPLGSKVRVTSTFQMAECASLTFDTSGRILTICVGVEGPRLMLLNTETLDALASFPLPPRTFSGGANIFNDFSGGGYFYLDNRDRAVIPTNNRQIWVVGLTDAEYGYGGEHYFELDEVHDLSTVALPNEGILSVLPDYDGRIWFATSRGLVGYVDRKSGDVSSLRLEDETISNSFAVDEDGGVYIVSDRALYRFEKGGEGRPAVRWRARYERGERQKPGQVNFGSGTTPTVLGERYVAITDNADPRMNVLVFDRRSGEPVCSEPVFAPKKGATDNSLIGIGDSLVVENNYGYTGPGAATQGASTQPGFARVDVESGRCRTVWESEERAPSVVPKLSLRTGLIYTYTKEPRDDGDDAWYFTAIDFRTGKTVFKALAGTGLGFNNNWAPVSLSENGTAYVGALGGLVRLADRK